jgi:hypothetical protein
VETIGKQLLDRYERICLLCAEPTADRCHRRLVAEYWHEHIEDASIAHL